MSTFEPTHTLWTGEMNIPVRAVKVKRGLIHLFTERDVDIPSYTKDSEGIFPRNSNSALYRAKIDTL